MDQAEGTAGALVTNRLNALAAMGNTAVENANSLLTNLSASLNEIQAPTVNLVDQLEAPTIQGFDYSRPDIGTVNFLEPPSNSASAPTVKEITPIETSSIDSALTALQGMASNVSTPSPPSINLPKAPDVATVDGSISVNLPNAPTEVPAINAKAPEFSIPQPIPGIVTPVMQEVSFPDAPPLNFSGLKAPLEPTLSSVEIPLAPDLSIPTVPDISPIEYPDLPALNALAFEADKPEADLDRLVPAEFSHASVSYVSDVWGTIVDKIKSDISTGGVGVAADIREGMYQEMCYLQRAEHERSYNEAQDRYGATGFSLPTGALVSALSAVESENKRHEEGFRRKIYLDEMTLAQQNTQWAMDKGVQVEQILRDFFDKSENRRLEISKAIAQRGIEIFQSWVTKFNAEVESYKAEAAAYETRLKGELAKTELYRVSMEGKKIESEAHSLEIQAYAAQVGVIETKAKIFGIENESAKIRAELESLKIDRYRAALEAYTVGLEADKNVISLYSAKVDAEKTKQDLKIAKANIELEVEKAKISGNAITVDAQVKAELAAVQAYSTEVSAETEIAKANSSIQIANVNAQADIEKSRIQARVANIQAVSDANKANVDAYAATMGAEKIKADVYGAEVNAAGQSVALFGENVRAAAAKIDGFKAAIGAQAIVAECELKANSNMVEQYKAELAAYSAQIECTKVSNSSLADTFKASATAYAAEAEAVKSENLAKVEEMKANAQVAIANAQVLAEELRTITQGYVAIAEVKTKGAEGIASVQAQLAAAALNAANVNASYGQTMSSSYPHHPDVSISEIHTYKEK